MQNCTSGDFADEFYADNTYMLACTAAWPDGAYGNPADDCYTSNRVFETPKQIEKTKNQDRRPETDISRIQPALDLLLLSR